MVLAQLLALAVAIGANNFAAALALGAVGQAKQWPRVALVYGVMEFIVPLVGIWFGRPAPRVVGEVADWLGPALLTAAVIACAAVAIAVARLHVGRASRHVMEVVANVTSGLLLIGIGLLVALGVFCLTLGEAASD